MNLSSCHVVVVLKSVAVDGRRVVLVVDMRQRLLLMQLLLGRQGHRRVRSAATAARSASHVGEICVNLHANATLLLQLQLLLLLIYRRIVGMLQRTLGQRQRSEVAGTGEERVGKHRIQPRSFLGPVLYVTVARTKRCGRKRQGTKT
jgi:hypothetical protein